VSKFYSMLSCFDKIDNNPPKSRVHAQRKSLLPSEFGTRDGIHNSVLNDGKDEIDGVLAMQDLDRVSALKAELPHPVYASIARTACKLLQLC
jgi:hypothetical protein